MQSSHYYAYTCELEESAYMHIQGRGLQLKVLGYYCVVASVLGLVSRSFLSAFFLDFLQLVHTSMHFDDMKHPTFTKWMLGFELCVIESAFFSQGTCYPSARISWWKLHLVAAGIKRLPKPAGQSDEPYLEFWIVCCILKPEVISIQ